MTDRRMLPPCVVKELFVIWLQQSGIDYFLKKDFL